MTRSIDSNPACNSNDAGDPRFAGFLEVAPDAVVIADRSGRIVRVNAQAEVLFGYSRQDMIGNEIELLMPCRFRNDHVRQRNRYCAQPVTRPMGSGQRLFGRRKDGTEFPAEISLSPLSVDGEVVIASAIRDVTVQRRLEQDLLQRTRELEQAARHKDEFLGMVAHELRNPLGTIRNAVQVIAQIESPNAELRWAREVIGRQANHMAELISDLLDATRIAQGKIRICTERASVADIVSQAVETCQASILVRHQQLTVTLSDRPLFLMADRTRLIQVLVNLLTNASKFTDEGGFISVSAAAEDSELVFRVRDDGIGIAPEELPRIFDLFGQVPDALDRSDGGLGIGLAIVGHLVQLHGGTIRAFSEGAGRGSEFVVHLPLAGAVSSRERDDGSMGHCPADSRRRRILVADDNADLVEALSHLLRRKGHEVCVASDGPTALSLAEAFRPQLVFLDIELPRLDGIEVAMRMRHEQSLANVVLIATTGHSDTEFRRRVPTGVFDAHLEKPFRVEEMLDLLAEAWPRLSDPEETLKSAICAVGHSRSAEMARPRQHSRP